MHKSYGPVRFPRREEAARQNRLAVTQAAGELFVAQGYLATTVNQIADRAGVSRATVFNTVPGGKPELLKQARDIALAGDDDPIPVPERPWFRHAMSATDGAELLRRQAANYRMICERAAALEHELVVAAGHDVELTALLTTAREQRSAGARYVATRLVEIKAVRRSSLARAADTIYATAGPDVFLLLTRDRGWSGARYERWLAGALVALLLDGPPAG